ncbi:MAG: hypothetical protein LUE19_10040 [Clostridiales bacterium]|nr:hypothetical protein [Clostridiales bacterium]
MSMPRPENISPAQAYIPESSANADADIRDTKKKKGLIVAVIVIIIAAALAVAAFFVLKNPINEKQFQSHMEAGQTYLEEAAYEEAVDEFEAAIEIQSEAVEPYRLMAQAYIGLDDSANVEMTYNTIRGIIVENYEISDENELLEDSIELYVDAINYYGEQEDADMVKELAEEIVPILTEESDVEEIEELSEQWVQQIEASDIDEEDDGEDSEKSAWAELYVEFFEEYVLQDEGVGISDGSFFLIYLNDDEIPEILYRGKDYVESCSLLYIQKGQVKQFRTTHYLTPKFTERGGYFYTFLAHMGEFADQIVYLDENNDLITVFEGSYHDEAVDDDVVNTDYVANGTAVTESEYQELLENASDWMEDYETYTILELGEARLLKISSNLSYEEWPVYATPVATGITEMISYLQSE